MKRIAGTVFVMVLALLMTPLAMAADTTEIVREADITRRAENTSSTDNWVGYTRAGTPPTSLQFVNEPGNAPSGVGSLQFSTTTSSEKAFLFNYDHIGTGLAGIDAISYNTYRSAGSAQQVAALNLQVDYNGAATGGFTTLVFEPVYNTNQGAVVNGAWQKWIATGTGVWWSTQPINNQCAGATAACDKTWAEIVANNPDAVITGGIGINQGSGNPGLITYVDVFTFDSVTYDFEPNLPPDTTAPTVTVPSNITVRATSISGAQVNYTASAEDNVDGSITPVCEPASGSTFAPGKTTVTCTATDKAGNTGTGSFDVTVSFVQSGFYQPIDMNNIVNKARRGSVVPVKFKVFADNNVEITDVAVVKSIGYQSSNACTTTSGDDVETYASSTAALRYDPTAGQFIFNWQVPSSPGCYSLTMKTIDGQPLTAIFQIK